MVRKKLAMAVLALSAMQADLASALGLGNVAVKSQLNQPLDAEIRLLETGELDDAQVRVRLAGAEDFQRAGVERDYFLNNLKFSVELDENGSGGVIRVTTREPVVEPYLNFIIEARWPSGRLLREYAVLLDPPTFSADATPPAPRTDSGLSTVQQRSQAAPPRSVDAPRASQPASGRSFPAAPVDGEYRVQSSDTLLQIAGRFRPADDTSVHQTMLAIQQANPNAFIRNNINLIKAGSVLRLPVADEVRQIEADAALQEVIAQNQAWRDGSDRTSEMLAAPQLDARSGGDEEGGAASAAERLSIASSGESERSSAGDGTGAPGADGVAALQSELLTTQESLDSARRENDELQSRLDDMERQIATLQRLLALKDDQLAALQDTAVESQAGAGNESMAAEPVDQSAAAEDDELVAAVPPPKPAPTVTTPPRKAEPSLIDSLLANPWLPAGAAALLALLAGGIFAARRRRAQAEAEAEAMAELELAEHAAASAPAPVAEPDTAPMATAPVAAAAAVAGAAVGAAADDEPASVASAPVRAETGDVIAEADIYVAYGRYQQAANLLRGAIEQEPARSDLRVKLLEVHLETRDREAFRHEFLQLQELGDEAAVVRVKEMLSSVDGVSDWLNGLPGGSGGTFVTGAAGAAGLAAASAAAAADEEELFGADGDENVADEETFELELDDAPATGGENELDLDWLNETPTAEADEADEGFVLDLDEDEPVEATSTPLMLDPQFDAPAPLAETSAGGEAEEEVELELDGPLDLDELSLEEPGAATLAIEEPEPGNESAPAELLGGLDLEDDELELADDDLDRALSELDGGSLDALTAEFGDLGSDELAPKDDLGFQPQADLEPVAETEEVRADTGAGGLDFDADWLAESDAGAEAPTEPAAESVDEVEDAPRLISEPDPVVAEPVPFPVEGLGDLNPAALDEVTEIDELDDLEVEEAAVTTDALDEAFADFEALGAELEATGAISDADRAPLQEQAPESIEPDLGVDLAALEPYTPEVAASDDADEFDFLADADEVATKLDLARAYIDMGDTDGARDILGEVVQEGTDPQREEAQSLLERIV